MLKALQAHPLPEGMDFVAGVIDPKSTYVETPEEVAGRIGRVLDVVPPIGSVSPRAVDSRTSPGSPPTRRSGRWPTAQSWRGSVSGRRSRPRGAGRPPRATQPYRAVTPPSAVTIEPVMNADSSLARKSARAAMSSTPPTRPSG